MAVRRSTFGAVTDADLKRFREILGNDGVITDKSRLEAFNTDLMLKWMGSSPVALLPKSTHELSEIMKHCHARKLAVVPQGGNTGLVGGSVPLHDEVILSTKRMNKIIDIDAAASVAVAEAGVILEDLDEELSKHGLTVPVDLGPRGKVQMGGVISSNAGGLRVIRYGSLKGSVLGLEVVLANGTVLDALRTLRKDNTGYDLKQLFIGSEGTLGIVTKVAILAPKALSSTHVALFAAPSFASCVEILQNAKAHLGEILSAFEFFDRASLDLQLIHNKGTKDPFPTKSPCYLVVETSGSNAAHDLEKLEAFKASIQASGLTTYGIIGKDEKENRELWKPRENLTIALKKAGAVYKYDISLPTKGIYGLVEAMRARLAKFPDVTVVSEAHLGDGNLHLNISAPDYTDALKNAIEPFVYEYAEQHRGSVSAEHGLGAMKSEVMGRYKPEPAVTIMGGVKQLLDPLGILNPYKVLPAHATVGRTVMAKL
jgi:D-2-hydroxyglutarate dehydrogenase